MHGVIWFLIIIGYISYFLTSDVVIVLYFFLYNGFKT